MIGKTQTTHPSYHAFSCAKYSKCHPAQEAINASRNSGTLCVASNHLRFFYHLGGAISPKQACRLLVVNTSCVPNQKVPLGKLQNLPPMFTTSSLHTDKITRYQAFGWHMFLP